MRRKKISHLRNFVLGQSHHAQEIIWRRIGGGEGGAQKTRYFYFFAETKKTIKNQGGRLYCVVVTAGSSLQSRLSRQGLGDHHTLLFSSHWGPKFLLLGLCPPSTFFFVLLFLLTLVYGITRRMFRALLRTSWCPRLSLSLSLWGQVHDQKVYSYQYM